MAVDKNKKIREKEYEEASKRKFMNQKKAMILPHTIIFAIELICIILLIVIDGAGTVFDESSKLFTIMLICMTAVPLISLIITLLASKTTHLLVTLTLYQLSIIPLIIGYLIKYDEMRSCSSYNMTIFYFIFMVMYLVNTSVVFRVKSKYLASNEHM